MGIETQIEAINKVASPITKIFTRGKIMLKNMVASVLAAAGLLSLNSSPTLARPSVDFRYHQTYYPSTCTIGINGEKFTCDYTVLGAFNNGSANIKLCSRRYCLILILTRTQLINVADGEDFSVRRIALQRGNTITDEWKGYMECGFNSQAMGCVGKLTNGSNVAIYVE
ncbi:hypothetical protein NIES2111_65140 (plasmid) [Nostoc sp. NIES-2111]|nr:hypothetical protein NIES2111_65140 [Nostoc sp. NIES-2111]